MGKYEQLSAFLKRQYGSKIPITFKEIEEIVGFPLPASARSHRAWWSNNPDNSVMTKEWLEAGFVSEQVDMTAERLVFRRDAGRQERARTRPLTGRHPLFGALKGMIRLAPGTDLTAPADPDWGNGG